MLVTRCKAKPITKTSIASFGLRVKSQTEFGEAEEPDKAFTRERLTLARRPVARWNPRGKRWPEAGHRPAIRQIRFALTLSQRRFFAERLGAKERASWPRL